MRKFVLFIAVVAVVIVAGVAYFQATTPTTSPGVTMPLDRRQARLLASAPASAQMVALIPSAAAFQTKALANPVARDAAAAWLSKQQLPRPWIMGAADLVVWRTGRQTTFSVHLDPVRALVARVYLMLAGGESRFLINTGSAQPLGETALNELLRPAAGLERGDAILIQRDRRGGFPPIGRPSITLVNVSDKQIDLTSVSGVQTPALSGAEGPSSVLIGQNRLPSNALLAATFASPPRALSDVDRLFGTKISTLLADGGTIVLYDVNTETLLPRPKGLIVVAATPEKRAAAERLVNVAEVVGEVRETPEQILIAFDKTSLPAWDTAAFQPPPWTGGDWSMRGSPERLAPVLQELGDNPGLRLATPRLYRSIRDLRRWMGELSRAETVEAAHRQSAEREELRVRITSK